jgi:class 3 adenylate cyclase
MARSKYAGDIRYFLANQGYISTQKRMIALNIEFTNRIRSFLPKEISSRLSRHLTQNRLTVLQAVDQVLAPTGRQIACLFTDIRGFATGQAHHDHQSDERVVWNATTGSRLVEEHRGIPRKVGDLLFAYFDDQSIYSNLTRCLLAAIAIVDTNAQLKEADEGRTTAGGRYVLVSTGDAVVGNLGGYESSIEITALGSPVNLLSRIDELAKNPSFRKCAHERDLVLCPHTATLLQRLELPWHIERLAVAELGTSIRDFEEIDSVWLFSSDEHNRRMLLAVNGVIKMQHEARAYPN